jgi:alanyl-tRNA synthetase
MTGNDIRRRFIEYFEAQGHKHVRSSSLVPIGDPTLLFTNAGMNQFKNVFLGLEQRDYRRAVTAQKCVRAGGKHNDLENVGFTNRHHTFFEMLGNFSFGDYFKKDAIAFAWELITSPKWFGIPKDKLFATIFKGENGIPRDDEAYQHWVSQGIPKNRIYEFGSKDNFWAMGDTGPCGPCSEIHYDMGPQASDLGHGVTAPACEFGCDCGRYVEIWNLVFMQFNREPSLLATVGRMPTLPRPSIDTGAGLERFAAVLQGKISNFDTDLFQPLIAHAEKLTGTKYGGDARTDASLRIIADHSRAATFLITDGVLPSNDGRGYVLRKIVRRAIDFGRALNKREPFLYVMAGHVAELMKEAYPDVMESRGAVARVILSEEQKYARLIFPAEEQFVKRIESGPMIPDEALKTIQEAGSEMGAYSKEQIERAKAHRRFEKKEGRFIIYGDHFFYAYTTLGLRPDHVRDMAAAYGWFVPNDADDRFKQLMEEDRQRAKASWKGVHKEAANPVFAKLAETYKTEPDFYFEAAARDCRIEAIVTKDGPVNEIPAGAEAEIVLDRTTFYAESGGQVADTGKLYDNSESLELAEVRGAYYPVAGLIAHRVVTKERLRVGDRVATVPDGDRRTHIKRNHTATHLMHAALRGILGTHVKQAGSLVAPDHLRFDFTHFRGVDPAELREIEQQVNEQILRNHEIETDIMALDNALASGALAFFGDRYPENNVRVITIPDAASPRGFYSKELCGGTHVKRTGDIGIFKFVAEQSVASGVRRVEAITGVQGLERFQTTMARLRGLATTLNAGEEALEAAVERLEQQSRQLEKQLEALKKKAAHSQVDELLAQTRAVKDVKVLSARVADADRETLRQMVDTLRQKLGSGVVVLGTAEDGKVALISGVTKDLAGRLHAGKIIQAVSKIVGGSGGGRPDLAEAGGKDTSMLEKAIAGVYEIVEQMLLSP